MKMDTTFMDSENSKTSETFTFTDELHLRRGEKSVYQ